MSLLALIAGVLFAAPPSAAVDPFYESLLREGRLAYERGDWAGTVESLRLACFGLLDEPALLTEGLARLAIAQARAGDGPGFRETFQRIVDVDERFGTYGAATLPAELRSALESTVVETIPAEYLASSPAFRHLARGTPTPTTVENLGGMAPKRRRSALLERLEADPDNHGLTLLLAATELELGNVEDALEAATRTLTLDPGNQDALCVRGRSQAGLGRCNLAVLDLETCRKVYTDAATALTLLECRAELGQIAEARALLRALPDAVREERPIQRFARSLPEPSGSPPASAGNPPTGTPAAAASTAGLGDGERETLEQARTLLRQARTAETLERTVALARSVADRHPDEREAQHLVAEIAYRASRFGLAVEYFERGGIPGADEPNLLFYLAVSYWETSRPEAAADALRRALPNLKRSAYVDAYVEKILGRRGGQG